MESVGDGTDMGARVVVVLAVEILESNLGGGRLMVEDRKVEGMR